MAKEFIVNNGLIVDKGDLTITGSLLVSGSIQGNFAASKLNTVIDTSSIDNREILFIDSGTKPSSIYIDPYFTYNPATNTINVTASYAAAGGLQGLQGEQGIQGFQGDTGLQGIQGTVGLQGITGSQGIQGFQGFTGIQGITGSQGIQGTTGDTGIGIQGATGEQGVQGFQGIQGTIGDTGIGTQGTQGLQGISGVTTFPYTGSAIITGSLALYGPANIYPKGFTPGLSINGDTIGTIVLQTTGSSGFSITADSSNGFSIYDINDTRTRFYMNDEGGFGFNTTDTSGYRFNVSGSSGFLNSVDITGSLKVLGGITGSLLGSASYADTLDGLNSSDFVQTIGNQAIGGTKTFTDSVRIGQSGGNNGRINITENESGTILSLNAESSTGNLLFADNNDDTLLTLAQDGSGLTINQGNFIGDLTGTANSAITASHAVTASYYNGSVVSASYAVTASYVAGASSFPFTGNAVITGSLAVTTSITSSTVRISGSDNLLNIGPSLYVYGSGSGYPVFTVIGSQGELFSVTDSLTGSLFSVSDISGLPILEVFSDDTIVMGDYQAPSLFATKRHVSTVGNNTIYSLITSSYNGAFFDYIITSASNARAGSITAINLNSSVQFNETTTMDIGNTSGVNFTVQISGNNMNLTGSFTTANWVMKTIVRGI